MAVPPRPSRPAQCSRDLTDGLAGSERAHGLGGQQVSADPPVSTLDLVDHAPGDLPHVLPLDGDHGVREPLDNVVLLVFGEDSLDECHVDQWHVLFLLLCWDWSYAS